MKALVLSNDEARKLAVEWHVAVFAGDPDFLRDVLLDSEGLKVKCFEGNYDLHNLIGEWSYVDIVSLLTKAGIDVGDKYWTSILINQKECVYFEIWNLSWRDTFLSKKDKERELAGDYNG